MTRPARLTVSRLEDRLTPYAGLDPTFGTNGAVLTTPGYFGNRPDLAAQPDGHLVVLDTAAGQLSRYNPDGTLDSEFVSPSGRVVDVAIGADGGIYYLAKEGPVYSLPQTTIVGRLTPAGLPDAGFGGDGTVTLDPRQAGELLVVGPDGAVTVVGQKIFFGGVPVTRLTPTGVPDVGFGTDGTVVVAESSGPANWLYGRPMDAAATPDGGLVLIAQETDYGYPTARATTLVFKLTAAGAADAGFDGDGVWSGDLPAGGGDVGNLAVTPDGGVLVGISTYTPDEPSATGASVYRLTPAGALDPAFGTGGVAMAVPGGGFAGYTGMSLLPDGRIVVVSGRGSSDDLAVGVLDPDGSPADFFGDGAAVAGFPLAGQFGRVSAGAAVTAGDRVVLVGQVYPSSWLGDSLNRLGLVALTERADALPVDSFVPPEPPVPGEPPPPPEPVPGEPPPIEVVPISAPPIDPIPIDPILVGPPFVPPPTGDQPESLTGNEPHDSIPLPSIPPPVSPLVSGPPTPGDVNGDGVADRAVTDGPTVAIVSGADGTTLLPAFAPFEASYTGALNAILVNISGVGDGGRPELVVAPDDGGGPVVAVYRADGGELARFWGIDDIAFRGGVRLAAGDLNADSTADLVVTAGNGGGPRVAVFDGESIGGPVRRLVPDFFAFEPEQRGGAFVAVANRQLVFGAGPGGAPRVRAVDGRSLLEAAPATLDALPPAAVRVDRFVGDTDGRDGARLTLRVAGGGRLELLAGDVDEPIVMFGISATGQNT